MKLQTLLFLILGLNTGLHAQNCPTGTCDTHIEYIDIDAQPDCMSGTTVDFIGDIDNNSDCEDINGGNCYKWVIYKSPTSAAQGITANIGQGNGCNGEADNFYTLIGGVCTDQGSSGSQNEFTFSFGASDTMTIWICDGSSGVVGICAICVQYAVMPVEFGDFEVSNTKDGVSLSWNTLTEVNNEGFVVQKKYEYSDWINVSFIHGSGNSNVNHDYSYVDHDVKQSGKITYRLKQTDYDGNFSFSEEREIVNNTSFPELQEAIQNGTYYNILGQPVSEKKGLVVIQYKGHTYKLFITE